MAIKSLLTQLFCYLMMILNQTSVMNRGKLERGLCRWVVDGQVCGWWMGEGLFIPSDSYSISVLYLY